MRTFRRPSRDQELLQIVDAAFAESSAKAGSWLSCKRGCAQCCHGAFRISQLDVARLQAGMSALRESDPQKATRVEERAAEWLTRNRDGFPGSPEGVLYRSPEAEAAFEEFANDDPCPALDPETLTCDLYDFRPMTCRIFGPPVRSAEGLGVCELCFQGASNEDIARCEMLPDPDNLEEQLLFSFPKKSRNDETVVAFAVLPSAK